MRCSSQSLQERVVLASSCAYDLKYHRASDLRQWRSTGRHQAISQGHIQPLRLDANDQISGSHGAHVIDDSPYLSATVSRYNSNNSTGSCVRSYGCTLNAATRTLLSYPQTGMQSIGTEAHTSAESRQAPNVVRRLSQCRSALSAPQALPWEAWRDHPSQIISNRCDIRTGSHGTGVGCPGSRAIHHSLMAMERSYHQLRSENMALQSCNSG